MLVVFSISGISGLLVVGVCSISGIGGLLVAVVLFYPAVRMATNVSGCLCMAVRIIRTVINST